MIRSKVFQGFAVLLVMGVSRCTIGSDVVLENRYEAPLTVTLACANPDGIIDSIYPVRVFSIEDGEIHGYRMFCTDGWVAMRTSDGRVARDYFFSRPEIQKKFDDRLSGQNSTGSGSVKSDVGVPTLRLQFWDNGSVVVVWPRRGSEFFLPARTRELDAVEVESGCWISGIDPLFAGEEGAYGNGVGCWVGTPIEWASEMSLCGVGVGVLPVYSTLRMAILMPLWNRPLWKRSEEAAWGQLGDHCRWIWFNAGNGIPLRTGVPDSPPGLLTGKWQKAFDACWDQVMESDPDWEDPAQAQQTYENCMDEKGLGNPSNVFMPGVPEGPSPPAAQAPQ